MKVGFYPIIDSTRQWAKTHPWAKIATASLTQAGCEIVPFDNDSLSQLDQRAADLDVLHLNWPPELLSPAMFKHRQKLPRRWFEAFFRRELERRMAPLRKLNLPIAWQQHDLPTGPSPMHVELSTLMFRAWHEIADGLIYYEASARPPIEELLGPSGDRVVGVAHLGDYTHLHGPPVDLSSARQRQNLPPEATLFLYSGTVRASRSPGRFIQAFKAQNDPDTHLVVTGRGVKMFAQDCADDPRITLIQGLVEQDDYRDLMCAANFVVNDAHRYLGSAVIRAAMGYGVPVIASPFGCTADLAREAFIPVADHDEALHEAIRAAVAMPAEAYQAMSKAARQRDAERPWSAYAQGCLDVYEKIIARSSA